MTQQVQIYQPFEGSITTTIPQLLESQRLLISPKHLAESRLYARSEQDRQMLTGHVIYTGAIAIGEPSSEKPEAFKIGLYSDPIVQQLIKGINKNSQLIDLSIKPEIADMTDSDIYHSIAGLALKHSDIALPDGQCRITNTKKQEILEFLLQGDTYLVKEYIADIEKQGTIAETDEFMFHESQGFRLLGFGGTSDEVGEGIVSANSQLDENTKIIGIDPAAYDAHQHRLEKILAAGSGAHIVTTSSPQPGMPYDIKIIPIESMQQLQRLKPQDIFGPDVQM